MPPNDERPIQIEGGGDLAGFLLSNLTAALRHHEPDARRIAVLNLGRVGPAASSSIPELVRMMKEDPEAELRRFAADALAGMGQCAVPWLMHALAGGGEAVAGEAARALAAVGIQEADRFPALIEAMRDSDPICRTQAARVLSDIMTDRVDCKPFPCDQAMFQRAVQTFRSVLGDPESLVRVIAAYTLWVVRRDASGAAAMERIVEGPDDPHRELATQVLGLIRMGSKEDE